ncbi:MAG: hypothetical protein ACKOXT_04750, partial [Actinomycetota bacterium]
MNRQPVTHIPTAKRLLNQIGSRYALSNATLIAFAVPAFATTLIFESTKLEQPLSLRMFFSLIGYLATIAVLLFARIYLPDKPRPSRPGLILMVFAIAGYVRGIVLTLISNYTVGISLDETLYRILGGPIFTTVMLTLCTVLVANNLRHREALRDLTTKRHQLELRSAGDRAKAEVQREELLSKVREILAPAISRVQGNLSSDSVQGAINSLTSTIDKVIRPL